MRNIGTESSTCANVNENVAGGRKTNDVDAIAATQGTVEGGEDAVLVNVSGRGDAIVFSDEVESVPSLDEESDDDEEDSDDDSWDSEDEEDEEVDEELEEILAERLRILSDCRALKNLAEAFLHPEQPVHADPSTFGRNYFERPSAPPVKEDEEADEEAEILEDVMMLKKAARAYLHPEDPVKVEDATLFGRNYFERPSAPEVEDYEVAEERARILAEAAALKKHAVYYMHPEVGVTKVDGEMFGRNFFERPSAPETEEDEFADERAEILEEAAALKKHAMAYLHPEIGVKTEDATLFGRNYFERPSAPAVEDAEEAEERARILAEAAALKKHAVDYMHPEVGVKSVDPTLFGRNYFNRYSAPETEEDEFADERAEILEEAAALKKHAMAYLHPEIGVKTEDATLFGRNYFERPSAPAVEDAEEAEERARILAEAAALKKSAAAFLHPEISVSVEDSTVFGRNYFNRFSAPESEDIEEAEEHARVLADAIALKKSAAAYLHPEVGIKSADGETFGRNYFERPSAPAMEDSDEAEEHARVLADAAALKKLATDYLHPEVGVKATDPTAFGRNYFNRYSAPAIELAKEEPKESPEQAESQDISAIKNLAAAVKGANLPSTKNSKLSSLDRDVSSAKKSASNVDLFGLSDEVH